MDLDELRKRVFLDFFSTRARANLSTKPGASEVERIAEKYGVSLDELLATLVYGDDFVQALKLRVGPGDELDATEAAAEKLVNFLETVKPLLKMSERLSIKNALGQVTNLIENLRVLVKESEEKLRAKDYRIDAEARLTTVPRGGRPKLFQTKIIVHLYDYLHPRWCTQFHDDTWNPLDLRQDIVALLETYFPVDLEDVRSAIDNHKQRQ